MDSGDHWAFEHRRVVLAVLCTSMFVVVLDNTILSVAIPTITRAFGATSSEIQWVIDAYTLVFAGLLIAGGSFADRFGRRGTLRFGLAVFGAGSIAAAASGSVGMLIGTRAFMGLGAAALMPASLAIIATLFPPGERAFAIGIWAATAGIASVAGPVGGGLLLEHFSWRAIFLVNVPFVALALAATLVIVPTGRHPDAPRIDGVGVGLSIATLTALLYGVIAAADAGWGNTGTLTAFAISTGLGFACIRHLRRAAAPMVDPRAFRDPHLSGAVVSMMCLLFGMFAALYGTAQYFQFVLGYSPLRSGLTSAPVAIVVVIVSPLSGRIVSHIGVRVTVALGLASVATGLFLLGQLGATSKLADIVWPELFLGAGAGLATAPLAQAIVTGFAARKAGVASGINDTARQVGGALGIAVVGTVTASAYAGSLADALRRSALATRVSGASARSIGATLDSASKLEPGSRAVLGRAARAAFTDGYHSGMKVAAIVLAGGTVIAALSLVSDRADGVDPVATDPAVLHPR